MIYWIITTSIQRNEYSLSCGQVAEPKREERYIECIKSCMEIVHKVQNETNVGILPIRPIVVENNGKRQTSFNKLGCEVFYTNNNVLKFGHKGGNELIDVKDVLKHYDIKDDDLVIKFTGRYKFMNDSFLKNVIKNKDKYDAFVKFYNVCTNEFMHKDCVLGVLAVRAKYLKDFDYNYTQSAEVEFATHIRENVSDERLCEIKDLGLQCCFSDDLRIQYV